LFRRRRQVANHKRLFYAGAGALCLALAFGVGVMSARAQNDARGAASNSIVARELVIVDEHGKKRIVMRTTNGKPALALIDTAGQIRAALVLSADGSPTLGLNAPDGKARAMLSAAFGSALELSDSRGTTRVEVAVTSTDDAAMALYDRRGQVAWNTAKVAR
jgi:hypothetical protein